MHLKRIKKGSKVVVKATGEEMVVYKNKVGKPYPFYCAAENASKDAELFPYREDELELIKP